MITGFAMGVYACFATIHCHEYITKLVEQNQFQIKDKVDIECAIKSTIMIDSEMGVQAISDILWWSADFLVENSEISIIAKDNMIELIFPKEDVVVKRFQECLNQYKNPEKDMVLFGAINYIFDVRGEVEFSNDNHRIQIIFPIAK